MQLVIADTGPINYLLLIGHLDVLPLLFERVILPAVVRNELAAPSAPPGFETGLQLLRSGLKSVIGIQG